MVDELMSRLTCVSGGDGLIGAVFKRLGGEKTVLRTRNSHHRRWAVIHLSFLTSSPAKNGATRVEMPWNAQSSTEFNGSDAEPASLRIGDGKISASRTASHHLLPADTLRLRCAINLLSISKLPGTIGTQKTPLTVPNACRKRSAEGQETEIARSVRHMQKEARPVSIPCESLNVSSFERLVKCNLSLFLSDS